MGAGSIGKMICLKQLKDPTPRLCLFGFMAVVKTPEA